MSRCLLLSPFLELLVNIWRTRGMLRKKSATLGRTFAGSVGGYLPNTLTEMWDPQRDFAYLKLPTSGVRSAVALSGFVLASPLQPFPLAHVARNNRTTPQVMVITSEGVLHVYAIDLETGGECVLQKTYRCALAFPSDLVEQF